MNNNQSCMFQSNNKPMIIELNQVFENPLFKRRMTSHHDMIC